MFKLSKITNDNLQYISVENSSGNTQLKLCLNQGGRIDQLKINDIEVIVSIDSKTYKDNYASAILFPFANRIKNGKYTFDDINYTLDCNETDKNNALHGLVYDKTFEYITKKMTSDSASVVLRYENQKTSKGFPFLYEIWLTYTINDTSITLSVHIENKDEIAFPFTLGWHPYFLSSKLADSTINFDSKTKFAFDNQQIISGQINFDEDMPYSLKDATLDDGYILATDGVQLVTPDYKMTLKSSSKQTYLQLYTPNDANSIAIEPMTGACDSYNNEIGLQVLHPNQNFNIEWTVSIEQRNLKNLTNS